MRRSRQEEGADGVLPGNGQRGQVRRNDVELRDETAAIRFTWGEWGYCPPGFLVCGFAECVATGTKASGRKAQGGRSFLLGAGMPSECGEFAKASNPIRSQSRGVEGGGRQRGRGIEGPKGEGVQEEASRSPESVSSAEKCGRHLELVPERSR